MSPGQTPPNLTPPGARVNASGQTSREKNRRYLIWGLAFLLLALALIVLIFLPAKVKQLDQALSVPSSPAIITPPSASTTSGVSQHDAGLALQAFLRLRAQPELQGAELWAPPLWSEATTAAELGDEHYGHRRFKQAQSAYEAASQSLRSLQANRPQILSEVLISGQTLLQENQAGPAIKAFERVLLMQADHPKAQTGLAKARVRMQVLDLMKDGKQAEINNKPALAAEAYTAALQLDSSYRAAQSALQAVNK
ncbi:MAG: hypothetical protein GY726_08515, partial [Proteobacteria bacterium]|nr:hypothetical protein [Pseudomonadota bacterium]